jgi:hypothetical protein
MVLRHGRINLNFGSSGLIAFQDSKLEVLEMILEIVAVSFLTQLATTILALLIIRRRRDVFHYVAKSDPG